MRQFAKPSLLAAIPEETTIFNFRRLPERYGLAAQLLQAVNQHLQDNRSLLRTGTMVDTTIINASGSTRNSSGTRDPEMHQTKKGNPWFSGMKMHIGVGRGSSPVQAVVSAAANVADVTQADTLLHGGEKVVYADAGYTGADTRDALKEKEILWNVAENGAQVATLFALSNLWMARKRWLTTAGKLHPKNGKQAIFEVIPV